MDAYHSRNWDCKGQTGASLTLGKGALVNVSFRQKCNTKSSTETELVDVNDVLSKVLWSLYFIRAQGHDTKRAQIYQDNKSAILLSTNGRFSSSKRMKDIKHKYFFVTDKVADGDILVEYKPTTAMWADISTKPKQGSAFRLDRSEMMNCPVDLPDSIPFKSL